MTVPITCALCFHTLGQQQLLMLVLAEPFDTPVPSFQPYYARFFEAHEYTIFQAHSSCYVTAV